jgi:hypothetical protein
MLNWNKFNKAWCFLRLVELSHRRDLPPQTLRTFLPQTPLILGHGQTFPGLYGLCVLFYCLLSVPQLVDWFVCSAGTALFSDGYANGVIGSGA